MTTCIKCGKPVPDGELFCRECSLNPQIADITAPEHPAPVPQGRMQAPVKTAPRQVKKAPSPVAVGEKKKSGRGKTAALAVAILLALGFAALAGYQYFDMKSQRTALRVRESALNSRESELMELKNQVQTLSDQLDQASATIQEQADRISGLQSNVASAESTANQTQYDMTTQRTELEQLSEENAGLLDSVEQLEQERESLTDSMDSLTAANQALSALNVTYSAKANFMDAYVVFVENDGTGRYHKYDCTDFTRKSFWAYSRKLAENNGYTACPNCFG